MTQSKPYLNRTNKTDNSHALQAWAAKQCSLTPKGMKLIKRTVIVACCGFIFMLGAAVNDVLSHLAMEKTFIEQVKAQANQKKLRAHVATGTAKGDQAHKKQPALSSGKP